MDLSVIIPARNEEFLQNTINSVLSNARADTEVIAILDGYWPNPGIEDHPQLRLIHYTEPIGQRAATNTGVRMSRAKYVMKLDAHCAVDEGFDVKLMADMEPDWIVVPRMHGLDVFHWTCPQCGQEYEQGPVRTVCDGEKVAKSANLVTQKCGFEGEFQKKTIYTKRRHSVDYMWFTPDQNTKHFDRNALGDLDKAVYSHKHRSWAQGEITDCMCLIGACWFLERDWYWKIGGCDEGYGSWGGQGAEMSQKAWMSGGSLKVNKKTWFAHLFRTQPGFSWPYTNPASAQAAARAYGKDLWLNDKWPLAKRKLSWVIEKFAPLPPEWDSYKSEDRPIFFGANTRKGIVYYTDNQCEERVLLAVRNQIKASCNGHEIVSVSQVPIGFGRNIVVPEPRGQLTMFKQILAGIEACEAGVIYLCEHDVLYHKDHFWFTPERNDAYYYNENTWKVCADSGQAVFYYCKQTSGLCAHRDLLLEHYRKRVARTEKEGYNRNTGYEPGTHSLPNGIDNFKAIGWMAKHPNVDIRHSNNLTRSRYSRDKFRSQKACQGWTLSSRVPHWGETKGCFDEFIKRFV